MDTFSFSAAIKKPSSLQVGDHLTVRNTFPLTVRTKIIAEVPFYHHGIHVGNEKVIHWTTGASHMAGMAALGRTKTTGSVSLTSIEGFSPGGRDQIHVVDYEYKFSRPEVISRAEAAIGKEDFTTGHYGLVSNNCEHFAYWCTTGRKCCMQIAGFEARIAEVAGTTLVVGTRNSFWTLMRRLFPLALRGSIPMRLLTPAGWTVTGVLGLISLWSALDSLKQAGVLPELADGLQLQVTELNSLHGPRSIAQSGMPATKSPIAPTP